MLNSKQIEQAKDLCFNCRGTFCKQEGMRNRVWMYCKSGEIPKSLMDRQHIDIPVKWRKARSCSFFIKHDDEYCYTEEPCLICPKNPYRNISSSDFVPCRECTLYDITSVNSPEDKRRIQDLINNYYERIGK